MIHEILGFLHFDLIFLDKKSKKKRIIKELRKMNNNNNSLNFGFLKSKFYLLDDLVNELI